jgi:serine/threonine protein kinase
MAHDTTTPAVEHFLQAVARSGLLSRAQVDDALGRAPADRRTHPRALADWLCQEGRLTRFQARKLLQGRTRGLVVGTYHILAPIACGGMGTVYLARDAVGGELVALKVLPPKQARAEERLRARFLREMELGQRVGHPHIAQVYEVGVSGGVYFIAMEFIAGRSLRQLVRAKGPLSVARAARLFIEVAAGLAHAHRRGLIHRDLKPSNLMVTPDGHATLLDLGLALVRGEEGADHTVVGGRGYVLGTMDYIAPEQSEDPTQVCPRSDIYALGCTLYFALAGRPPFPGGSSIQKIMRHRTEEPTPLEQLSPAVPPEFAALVRKMCAKQPEDRFASADEVGEALVPWVADDGAVPATPGPDPATLVRQLDAAYSERKRGVPGRQHGQIRITRLPAANPFDGAKPPAWSAYVLPVLIGTVAGLAITVLFFVLTR